tara:strand:+ start:217 stop:567 length:351 start_codon:yes stop_codon:yes gene_type:complete
MADYIADPDNSNKQVPKALDRGIDAVNHATAPVKEVIQKRPNSVIINKIGHYGFLYETTCSIGGTSVSPGETYITGGRVIADTAGPQELPIQPVAWVRDSNGGAVGDITFVYKGVK